MWIRGVRGATCASANSKEAIIEATAAMLQRIVAENGIAPDDIASAFFSTTHDLNADFPAIAARQLGWRDGCAAQPADVRARDDSLEYDQTAGRDPACLYERSRAIAPGSDSRGVTAHTRQEQHATPNR
jgi:hypothetical protein